MVNLFLLCAPRRGWRHVQASAQRAHVDFLVAEKVVSVMDQLNTDSPVSLYAAFPPAVARRLTDKLEIHHTPKHGSWLTMAELELSVLQRQCLGQRFADRETMERAVAAWTERRNTAAAAIRWQFTTTDARTKLRRLYPAFDA